jgi:hypothetical protein
MMVSGGEAQTSTMEPGETLGFAEFSPFPSIPSATFEDGPVVSELPTAHASPFRMAEFDAPENVAVSEANELLAELEDDEFDELLGELVDEAARLEMRADSEYGSVTPGAEAWLERLATLAEGAVDSMRADLGQRDLTSMSAQELESTLEAMSVAHVSGMSELEEQFLGGLIRKGRKLAQSAVKLAKKGVALAGKLLPIDAILGRLRAVVRPLLQRVLNSAIGKLPTAVQPLARSLADKLGVQLESEDFVEGERSTAPAGHFDMQLAGLMFAEDDFAAEQLIAEAADEVELGEGATDPAAGLAEARARLADQLVSAQPGTDPTAEIQQFIPAVMAMMPALKLVVRAVGRDRIVRTLAGFIAPLVATQIGPDAAKRIARPLADVGLRQIGLEVNSADEAQLAGEALASTVEDTVTAALQLPTEALTDELRLAAGVQHAFAKSAGRHLPAELIRADLPEREVDGARGVWVMLPRHHAPRFRYKKYSQVFVLPISRQLADAVPWTDGGSMQTHLEDEGITSWPVTAEVHLYEMLPGSQVGHIVDDEVGDEAGGRDVPGDFQPLTEQMAGLLLSEPRLGRGSGAQAQSVAQAAGRARYFRVNVPGMRRRRSGRPRRRATIRLRHGATPALRVAFRLSEREGHELAGRLERNDLAGALTWITARTGRLKTRTEKVLVHGLRRSQRLPYTAERVPQLATEIIAAVAAATSSELAHTPNRLGPAVRNAANGLTITFTVALTDQKPEASADVKPGWIPL